MVRPLDEVILNTWETEDLHLARMIEEGYNFLMLSDIESLCHDPDYVGALFGVVSVDVGKLPTKTERVHITIAKHLLKTRSMPMRKNTTSSVLVY